jgi:plasmid stability protein
MANLLVRDLDPETVARLKARASAHKRSLNREVQLVLEAAAAARTMAEARAAAEAVRRQFAGRTFSDSADLVREDRER